MPPTRAIAVPQAAGDARAERGHDRHVLARHEVLARQHLHRHAAQLRLAPRRRRPRPALRGLGPQSRQQPSGSADVPVPGHRAELSHGAAAVVRGGRGLGGISGSSGRRACRACSRARIGRRFSIGRLGRDKSADVRGDFESIATPGSTSAPAVRYAPSVPDIGASRERPHPAEVPGRRRLFHDAPHRARPAQGNGLHTTSPRPRTAPWRWRC